MKINPFPHNYYTKTQKNKINKKTRRQKKTPHLCHPLHIIQGDPPGAEQVAVGEELGCKVSHRQLGKDDLCPAGDTPVEPDHDTTKTRSNNKKHILIRRACLSK